MTVKMETARRSERTLAGIALFRNLPPDVVETLSQRCQWRRYPAHQAIVRYLDDTRDVFFVVCGTVRAIRFSASGREVSFRDLAAGEMFGELSAIDGRPRSADVVALTDSLVASMPSPVFWETLRRHESVTAATLQRLAVLVRLMTERVIELSTLPVPHRIQAEMLRLARNHAQGRKIAIIAPAPTHSAIASRVSTNREAVTRELGELGRAGLLVRRRDALIVPDVDTLASWVAKVLNM